MSCFKDLSYKHFGRLSVLWPAGRVPNGKKSTICYSCQCDCGNILTVRVGALLSGHTSSCGCFRRENSRALIKPVIDKYNYSHNLSRSPEYKIWSAMVQRCHNPKDKGYPNYGKRGIVVCEKWKRFEGFYADMGLRPDPGSSLDRIDNNGNYEPGNVRWATWSEQQNNKRVNVLLTFNNKTQNLTQWALEMSINPQTLRNRIGRLGWDIPDALLTPVKKQEWRKKCLK